MHFATKPLQHDIMYHMCHHPMSERSFFLRNYLDKSGIVLSGLCALHCIATIVIVSGLGLGGQFLMAEEWHHFGLFAAVVIAAIAIGWGLLTHRRRTPFVVASVGLAFMGGALASPHGTQEAVLTLIGVALVSLGHIMNLRKPG